MPKTWFQHDMFASHKDGLSALIDVGGFEAYGRFWAFMELFYSMQISRVEFNETIRINERTLLKELQMNCRSLPKLLSNFSNCLGIVFRKNAETFGNFYETTVPNSLSYLKNRTRKSVILKDKDKGKIKAKVKDRYNPIDDCLFWKDEDFKDAWDSWNIVRQKRRCSNSDRAMKELVNKIMTYSKGNKEIAIEILDKSAFKGYSDLYEIPEKTKNKGW